MALTDEVVELTNREVVGKGLGELRSKGLVPGVIHDHGAAIHVEAPETEMKKLYGEAGKHHPLQLKVGGKEFLALIKDVHTNPIRGRMEHIVFMAIKQDEKVEAEVPIRFEGDAPAERVGLVVLHQLDSVEVEALPRNLPEEFVVDATKLAELHDKITVEDLKIPEGVTILTEPEHSIAVVVESRAMAAEEETEAEVEEGEGEEGGEGEPKTGEAEGEAGKAPADAERGADNKTPQQS